MLIKEAPATYITELGRRELLDQVQQEFINGDLTLGQSLQMLRKYIAGLKQEEFAELCGVSRRTLAAIEADKANPTFNTINQLFGIFGLKIGLTSKYPGR